MDVQGTFNFALDNRGDRLSVICGDLLIDELDYGQADFDRPTGASLSLGATDAPGRNNPGAWCRGAAVWERETAGVLALPIHPAMPAIRIRVQRPPQDHCDGDDV